MGFLGKTVEGTMVLIVSMCYGVLFSLGMLSMILSIVILNMETPLPTTGPWMLLIGGFFLMVVNAFSLTALWNRNWLWLAFAEGAYAFLTVVIYASAIVAVCLALELESPVAEAISKGWDRGTAVKMEMHKL